MFESEDFDLDEDFLKDVDKKEEEYYSQRVEHESPSDPQAKRQKTQEHSIDSDLLSDITFDDEPDFAKKAPNPVTTSPEASEPEYVDVSSRRKRILDIFNSSPDCSQSENASQRNPRFSASNEKSQKLPNSPSPNENLEATRKSLALEILRKGSLNKNPKDINFSPPKSHNQRKIYPAVEKNSRNVDRSDEICLTNPAEVFKKPAGKSWKSPGKLSARNSPKFPSRDSAISAPRMTLVRKFPGPAGLLPDMPESNFDHANFLNNLHALDENQEDSNISEYCSQNTETLFSSGAWRTMLDDLPPNFLKGHEIATIKRSATDTPNYSRVPFVAGVVQRIDHSVDNPRLLLKDKTDSIEATMHSDLPLAHPNVFEPGVVILLRYAGILGIEGSLKCPGPQHHLMFTSRNLLAAYSEKARLVSSPWMDAIKKTAGSSTASEATTNDSGATRKNAGNSKKILCERNSVFADSNMEISDFESDEDDKMAFACINLDEIKDSQTASCFSKAGSKNLANFMIKTVEKRDEEIDQTFGSKNRQAGTKKSPKVVARKSPSDKNVGKREEKASEDSRGVEVVVRPKTITGIRSRLLQFRSNDVLTPPIGEDKVVEASPSTSVAIADSTRSNEVEGNSIVGTFGDDLLASDNDTDDELLSQLDVESIMTNYNAVSQNPAS